MNTLLAILLWLTIGFIDCWFKSRRVVAHEQAGRPWGTFPAFWKDQGVICWRNVVLIPLGLIVAGALWWFVGWKTAAIFAALFPLEFRAYWFWVYWITGQKQEFWVVGWEPLGKTIWRRQYNPFEVPAHPDWLRIFGIDLSWIHEGDVAFVLIAACVGVDLIG